MFFDSSDSSLFDVEKSCSLFDVALSVMVNIAKGKYLVVEHEHMDGLLLVDNKNYNFQEVQSVH